MIHLVIGRQGSGKTLFLVKKAYEYYKQGKTVYSNIALNFPYKVLDYNDIVECRLKDGAVFIDEIHLLLPSRMAMRKVNIEITNSFLSMARKQNIDIWATTQTERKVDVRFREEKDFLYLCSKFAKEKGQFREVMHNQNLSNNVSLIIKVLCQETFSGQTVEFSFLGNPYYSMYDTNQIIKVKGLKEK